MEVKRGLFWLIEGAGGAGKSTFAPELVDYLNSIGREAEETREPGGVPAAESLRELIFELKAKKSANADHLAALFMAARYFLAKELILPRLQNGVDVVNVRGFPSTAVYQGIDGANLELIEKMAKVVMGEARPDAVLLLDLSAETAQKRKAQDDGGDPFDQLGLRHFKKVIWRYRGLAEDGWGNMNWYKIDAEQSIEAVRVQIKRVVSEVIQKKA